MCIKPEIESNKNFATATTAGVLDTIPKEKSEVPSVVKGDGGVVTYEGMTKVCEEHDEKKKKFKNFEGVHRPMSIMERKEYEDIYTFWLSFWDNSFLSYGINNNIYSKAGRAKFRSRVNLLGDIVVATALMLIAESSRHFNANQTAMAAVTGYYLSALCFGFCHMSIHARSLDYHWSGSSYAIYIFAYIHHRTNESADTFTNQVLISMFPSVRRKGRMWYEYFKYGSLVYGCITSLSTRLMMGWFLLPWIMEAASHQHSHGHSRTLPPLSRFMITKVYARIGLCPTKEHHHKHHDDTVPTRFTNFTDLHAPIIDYVLNSLWDYAYNRWYEEGQLHDRAFSLQQSWIVFLGHTIGYSIAWLLAQSVGIYATKYCILLLVFFHFTDPLLLVRLYKKVITKTNK